MKAQARTGTAPEMALRRELHRRGLRYRVEVPLVPGTRRRRIDVAFTRQRVAVFVQGCFWHGCEEHFPHPVETNAWYWSAKLERNRARDSDTDQRLASAGWLVLRVWEHEDAVAAADRVERALGHSHETQR